MPRSYAPTVAPGDTRWRSHYQGHRTENGKPAQIEVLEQEVILRKDGTEVPTNAPGSTDSLHVSLDLTDPAVLASEFPELNPATNEPTGRTLTVGAAFAGYFSYIHHQQLLRDQAMEVQP